MAFLVHKSQRLEVETLCPRLVENYRIQILKREKLASQVLSLLAGIGVRQVIQQAANVRAVATAFAALRLWTSLHSKATPRSSEEEPRYDELRGARVDRAHALPQPAPL